MKVWTGYGTEHSSNLVIIGNFKTVEDAKEATSMIHELTEIVQADCTDGLIDVERPYSRYSERLMDFTKKTNFSCDRIGPMGLLYEYPDSVNFFAESCLIVFDGRNAV